MTRYAVLGAGALGLTVALRLLQSGDDVTLYEREAVPGGLASGFTIDSERSIWLERFYHHLFRSDTAAIALLRELGMQEYLEWQRPITSTYLGGRIAPLDSPLSLLRFPGLPFIDRVRMGASIALLRLMRNPSRLQHRTATEWVRRFMGTRSYGAIWDPLLRGKFGERADEIAMPWLWARLKDRTAQLGYIRGGFQRFYDTMATRIGDLGGDLKLGVEVTNITPEGAGLLVVSRNRTGATSRSHFDRIVSTLPTAVTCSLTPALGERYRRRYTGHSALTAHVLILALSRSLIPAYWMNICDSGFPFVVAVEHTRFRRPNEYAGYHIVYLGAYRDANDPVLKLSRDELIQLFAPHLKTINSSFDSNWICDGWLFSAPYAQPIVTREYVGAIPPFSTSIEGLFVANMFQVYPHDRGQNYSIALAEQLVKFLAKRDKQSRANT